ncbi:MAG: hypothetical protein F7C34_04845 [Desulfurococcales archaeon]|nr:hypothetical protein [Desulfurococcales archaeon]
MARATALAVITVVLLGLAVAVALAGVISITRISTSVAYTGLPIRVEPGRIAGSPDLNGTIDVQIGPNLSVSITVHPTYQLTAYPGLVNVTNIGNTTHNYSIIVVHPYTGPPGAAAYLAEFNASNGTLVIRANLSQAGVYGPYPIEPGETVELSLVTYYPEGEPLQEVNATFSIAVGKSQEVPPESLGG